MLGAGPGFVPDLPRIITVAAEGQLHPTLTSVLGTDPDHCLGHRPICTKPGFSMGAYLSQAYPELGTSDASEDDPLYRQVFVDSRTPTPAQRGTSRQRSPHQLPVRRRWCHR
jgi:hypothetical protein